MKMDNNLLLPALVFIPFIAGLICWLAEKISDVFPRWVALIGMLLTFVLTIVLYKQGQYSYELGQPIPSWAAEFNVQWISRLGINFHLAVDGLSLLMVGLTALLGILAVGCSWGEINRRVGFFHLNLLWSLGAVIGVFLAIDMFLFFFFWELMLVPIYFLIALWGHRGATGVSRTTAATKFFIYTQVAGLIMLLGILTLVAVGYSMTQQISFNYNYLLQVANMIDMQAPVLAYIVMVCLFIGFAVKLPVFPLHGWLPDAHAQAPTAGSVDLAGILIKTAAYGLLRFVIPFFPVASAQFADIAIILGLIGVFYGAWCAYQQTDIKRLLAYTSISHMGFVLLAIYAGNILTYQGLMIMMLAHGLASAALFIICGQLYERLGTRDMTLMGGVWGQFRYFPFFIIFFSAALMGIPGLGNFVGEFMILMGSYAKYPVYTIIAAVSLVFAGLYTLIMIHRTMFGTPNMDNDKRQNPLKDLTCREIGLLMVCVLGLLWLGLAPQAFLDISHSSMQWLVNSYLPMPVEPSQMAQPLVSLEQPLVEKP
ncbi:NADH-quinone oxidoreductase subunit M [Moraxella sp. ZY210820]|uniref:NADH-quinone oxidoreductase subunit M n=1 Tax=unclassified Moraxella TaxID=2685852 RepID=UPI0027309ED0|nr:NADH-quinone oxidoreductase subunit M [Moraxella sp. ZY210820]WLF85101.1 NADH-quinone oxidoreductase subunit M [Moraxella sp. ZY210820]